MTAARKFESFCIDPTETWMFAGNVSGQISVIRIENLSLVRDVQAHVGAIQAMAAHRSLPYVAALSTDRTVSIWIEHEGALSHLCHIPLRAIQPSNDPEVVPVVHSTSQALGFHNSKPRLVTRSANAGVVELEFDETGQYRVIWCLRLHGDADLISARFVEDGDQVLSGSIDGQFILSENGKEIRRWQIGASGNVHWAEHLFGTTYLLASDMRAVALVDISGRDEIIIGERFTRDDLEHVTYNRTSKRAFVASFDRTIYEIDTRSCLPIRVAYYPPFKCRWVKTLERSPSTLLVQCRDGGIYKANADTGECLGVIKQTPAALWTAVHTVDGHILLGGEGESLQRLAPSGVDPISRIRRFTHDVMDVGMASGSYTKRMVLQKTSGRLIIGRANGDLIMAKIDDAGTLRESSRVRNLGSAVRDVAIAPEGNDVFAACEDGSVYKLDLVNGDILLRWKSPSAQPIWSLAHNPERALVAVAERGGSMFLLDTTDFSVLFTGIETGRPKRMKFVDERLLLYNKLDQVYRFDLQKVEWSVLVDSQGNTVEDFIWDRERRYLVLVGYTQNIALCDFETGDVINVVPDQIDYSKGLAWVDEHPHPAAYPLDFITFGRSGMAHCFRIHDEKILALGPTWMAPTTGA